MSLPKRRFRSAHPNRDCGIRMRVLNSNRLLNDVGNPSGSPNRQLVFEYRRIARCGLSQSRAEPVGGLLDLQWIRFRRP